MSDHTPGPWMLIPIYNDEMRVWGFRLRPTDVEIKALQHDREAQANAKLIATAPKMYELLERLQPTFYGMLLQLMGGHPDEWPQDRTGVILLKELRELLQLIEEE